MQQGWEGILVTKSEYVIDRLQAEINHYKEVADMWEREYRTLQEECKFGAAVAIMIGLCLGVVIGTTITWL